jgi:cell division septation protein DedD
MLVTSNDPKSHIGAIVGATLGSILALLLSLILIILFLRRRKQMLLNDIDSGSTKQADEQEASSTCIDPFTLKHTSISASDPQIEQAFITDQKLSLGSPPGEAAVSGDNVESEPTGHPRNPSSNSHSEDASRSPSSTGSAATSMTPSTTTTARQHRLHEQEQARANQLASLEERIDSSEWVSRAEYNVMAAEMSRVRAEMAWFRDAQRSDWARGLSDEMPPPYATIEPRTL